MTYPFIHQSPLARRPCNRKTIAKGYKQQQQPASPQLQHTPPSLRNSENSKRVTRGPYTTPDAENTKPRTKNHFKTAYTTIYSSHIIIIPAPTRKQSENAALTSKPRRKPASRCLPTLNRRTTALHDLTNSSTNPFPLKKCCWMTIFEYV